MRQILIFTNPYSESLKAKQVSDEIRRLLSEKNIDHRFADGSWNTAWDGVTDAWVVGGDGTLNRFINTFREIDIPVATFKGGSANDFNWMLHHDSGTAEQVERALHGKETRVDGGDCNGQLFINGAGIGFDGAIVKDLIGKKKQVGKATYLFSVLRHIANYSEKNCVVTHEGGELSQPCFMISVANGQRYGGGFCVAPGASITDGVLDLNIVGKISALKRMKYLPVIEKGAHLELPFVQHYRSGEVTIRSSGEMPAHLDGEFISSDEFIVRCLPGKFRIRL